MRTLRRGLLLAALHASLLVGLWAKLLLDRATLPRVWVRVTPVDPNLPIRGRYLSLRMEVEPRGLAATAREAALTVAEGRLIASPVASAAGTRVRVQVRGDAVAVQEPIAFFIPEHAPDPSRRAQGEELWAEVTVPKRGPPRPIRLAVKKRSELRPLP